METPSTLRRKPAMESRKADVSMEVEADFEEYAEYYYPHIEVVEVNEVPITDTKPFITSTRGSRRVATANAAAGGISRRPPPPRGLKMYELDPNIYPEAANARASYENRLKRKQEKDKIVNEVISLRQRNKELEYENELLKIQLSNAGPQTTGNDWLNFFREAKIRPGLDLKYAIIFERNRITTNMLLNLTEANLRNMGIKPFGDIFSILKHAREVGKKMHDESAKAAAAAASGSSSKSNGRSRIPTPCFNVNDDDSDDDGPRIITIRSLADLIE